MGSNASTSGTQSNPLNESTPESENSSETISVESKVERAQQLIEAIRQKKAKEEIEREKAEEIERRKGMKEMQNSKRLREDKEALEIIKEREREKREEKLARDRVLAQIAADREERRKRQTIFQNPEEMASDKNVVETDVRQRTHEKARIQFRLPDGSTANHIFEANDSLQTVRQYVISNLNIRSFVLSTTFPRKEFSSEDYNKTLGELSLCPSSVLLVITKTGTNISRAVTSPSFLWQIIAYVCLPFAMIWNFMTTFFNGPNRRAETEDSNQTRPQNRTPKTFSNREGNITQLRDRMRDGDDDDNNTWNGNSTQQM